MKNNRFSVILMIILVSLLLAAIPVVVAREATGTVAANTQAPCRVPIDLPTIEAALADPLCNPINIAGGMFHENLHVTRDVTIQGALNADTYVNGSASGPVFELDPGVSATMRRITVTNGSEGGIVAGDGAALTLVDSAVVHNTSGANGGGIASFGALTVTNSLIFNNVAGANGGGILFGPPFAGRLTLVDSIVISNRAVSGGGLLNGPTGTVLISHTAFVSNTADLNGGGISNHGLMTMTVSAALGNSAGGSGGAIRNSQSSLALEASTLSQNRAADRGGAVFNAHGVVAITASTLNHNEAAHGAGYYHLAHLAGDSSSIANSTLSANTAITNGGGIYVQSGDLTLANATIYANSATSGGGVFEDEASLFPRDVFATNTIIAGSLAGGDCAGQVRSDDYNLAGDASCTGFTGAHDLTGVNPQLGPLQDNGGLTDTHAAPINSPALDAGNCLMPTDQRGVARPQRLQCDIGAYESELPFMVFLPVASR